jgi:hypothetical protein
MGQLRGAQRSKQSMLSHQPRIVSHCLQQRVCHFKRHPRPSQQVHPDYQSLGLFELLLQGLNHHCRGSAFGCRSGVSGLGCRRLFSKLLPLRGSAFREMAIRDRFEDNAQVL